MSTHMEDDLRRLLAERASELPADASTRLLSIDYRPRAVHARSALAVLATMLMTGATLAVSLIGFGTNAPRAFAGWSASPTTAVGNQVARARAACRSDLASVSRRERPGIPAVPPGGWRTVAVDTRGRYTLILFEAGGGQATSACLAGSRRGTSLGGAFGARPPAPVPPGHVAYSSSGSDTTPPDEGSQHFSRVDGRIGAGVTGVTIRLNNGTGVKATCSKGWFLAWWPGSHGIRATEVTTAGGTKVE